MNHEMDECEKVLEEVIRQVKDRIGGALWFKGVCTNDAREMFHSGKSVEEIVDHCEMETIYWDGEWWL